jgi:CheY-like chemotaxis protein
MMPEIDGFEVLKTIRSVEKTAEIPVLILTAKHITKDEMAFLKTNHIFQLIQKGAISKIELLAAIRTMVFEQTNLEEPIKEEKVIYHPLEKPLILVVEDNPDNMKTTIALLKEHYDTIEATNGQAGIALMKNCNPALVLLDLSLPIMDGFQVFKEIKKEETIRNIPVIALTARAMVGDREEILQYGFDGYISKPIDGLIFEKTIGEVLYAK